jgi:hypothetical protein
MYPDKLRVAGTFTNEVLPSFSLNASLTIWIWPYTGFGVFSVEKLESCFEDESVVECSLTGTYIDVACILVCRPGHHYYRSNISPDTLVYIIE